MNNKEVGLKSEYFLMSKLDELKTKYDYVNDWYDFDILGEKVELKSCRLSVKHNYYKRKGRKKIESYRVGRFIFSKDNMSRAIKEDIWVCLMARHFDQFIILGMVRAKEIGDRKYLTIHKTRELMMVDLGEWIEGHTKVGEGKNEKEKDI